MARAKKEAALTPEERLQAALVPDWEWPYKLPENWCWTYMGVPIAWGSGGTPSRKITEYYTGDIPWIKTGELNDEYIFQTEEHISQEAINHSSAKLFPENTIAIAMYGATIGKTGVFGIPATTNQACACGVCSAAVNYNYLFYYARSQKEAFIKKGKGGAQPNISQEVIKSHEFPLPPLTEQQRIVDRIESLFAKLDEAKEKAQTVVDSFETRKAAILHKAFAGELTANWREEHGVGMESWEMRSLERCGDWAGGGTPSMSHPEYWENGDILWITSKDMKSDVIEDTIMRTNMDGVNNSSANYISKPSVLFVMRSGILRRTLPICMVKVPFTVNQDLKAVTPATGIDLDYMFFACKNSEKRMLDTCMKNGTTVESINTKALMNFVIPIASLPEQAEIVRILDNLFAKEQQAKDAAEAVIDQIYLMKKSILARAFRGELGTNDPTDEPAVELIKSILQQKIEQGNKPKKQEKKDNHKEERIVAKTILEVLAVQKKATPEALKKGTELDIDDFYDQVKALIASKAITETREGNEVFLEVTHADRQADN